MTKLLWAGAVASMACVALAIPIAAPADPVASQVSAPVAKFKRASPKTAPVDRGLTTRDIGARTKRQPKVYGQAPEEACVFDDEFSSGAANIGTTFCTRQIGHQFLPEARRKKISAVQVPPGYVMFLYGNNSNGEYVIFCEVHGVRPALGPWCDNVAEGISLTPATEAQMQVATANENEVRDAYYRLQSQGEGFAPDIARRASAEAEAKRRAAEIEATQVRDYAAFVSENRDCVVKVRAYGFIDIFGSDRRQCVNVSTPNLGDAWNDAINFVTVGDFQQRGRAVVTLYQHINYQGASIRRTCGFFTLADVVVDEVSSIKIEILPQAVPCTMTRQEIHYWDP